MELQFAGTSLALMIGAYFDPQSTTAVFCSSSRQQFKAAAARPIKPGTESWQGNSRLVDRRIAPRKVNPNHLWQGQITESLCEKNLGLGSAHGQPGGDHVVPRIE
jgi:hypothetical protein